MSDPRTKTPSIKQSTAVIGLDDGVGVYKDLFLMFKVEASLCDDFSHDPEM